MPRDKQAERKHRKELRRKAKKRAVRKTANPVSKWWLTSRVRGQRQKLECAKRRTEREA